MTILQEIQKWASSLPIWQQDAIVRLMFYEELQIGDYDDLYALLKAQHGIPDPKKRAAKTLDRDAIEGDQDTTALVQLASIKNLCNVNALAGNQAIILNLEGLTVIYGDNGAGKSGYSRVLKKACRSRDQKEAILPDANLPPGKSGKATATFEIVQEGEPRVVEWVDGAPSPAELSSIAIFDSRCARAYIDDKDDFSFVPYGLDILANLAKACGHLKAMLDTDLAQMINTDAFLPLKSTTTAVGALLRNLTAKTTVAQVDVLAILGTAETERQHELASLLKEGNPKEKAQELKYRSARLTRLFNRCEELTMKVGDGEVAKLRALVDAQAAAKLAAELASQRFRETPEQLPATGGETWQALFEAARNFAAESHPESGFPHLGPDELCPLCQQPLGDAAKRLVDFDAFIQQDLEKTMRQKRALAVEAYHEWKEADLSITLDSELKSELDAHDVNLAKACTSLESALNDRRNAVKAACKPGSTWERIGAEPSADFLGLDVWAAKLLVDAANLEKASDEKVRGALDAEFKELEARKQLQAIRSPVIATIEKFILQAKIKSCLPSVRPTGISFKSTELTDKYVSKELEDRLNVEFKRLNVDDHRVSLQSFTERGKTLHKLVLKFPGQMEPKLILSEGEQRAIAIASFLAEVTVSGGKGGIVFDDPVSSLDHRRRGLVAKRLAEEARTRQVIVFTHDMYFLCILQQAADLVKASVTTVSLHRTSQGFGVAEVGLPFGVSPTSKRVGMLRVMLEECVRLQKAGDERVYSEHARRLYFNLRLAWERAVEEVLLNGAVIRFGEAVQTSRLSGVVVEDSDYATVCEGMTKCSKYAHDNAAIGMEEPPQPPEMAIDINALETWRKTTVQRNKETSDKRR